MSEETGEVKTVPYERFQGVVASRDELAGKLQDYESQLQQYTERAATADTLAAELEAARATHQRDLAYARAGLDEEGATVAEVFYGKLDGDDKPTRADWLKSIKDAPADAPKALRAYFEAEPAPAVEATPAPTRRPRARETGTLPPGTKSEVTQQEVKAAREHAVRTGDWSRYKNLRERLGLTGR